VEREVTVQDRVSCGIWRRRPSRRFRRVEKCASVYRWKSDREPFRFKSLKEEGGRPGIFKGLE
jgi:hypothetical protein